ncbi:hypothetical protein TRFO_14375 [Tritrichomonas foetus]|uniref:EF-hand domain-containing protein n=1 Tax=Tritrichomonas foetus TaxID=1144522 RepID=A0A1J4KVC6_9EUKA|nr:hypothetical protein TRFO_14375 [Tritrichomonas foetus]|eukprot:OHT15187.1 hypothetical protein TRFO_14375 [Tritrichomonas foetus]
MDTRPPPTILSFTATLISNNRDDALREFIVAFYVEDSSFSVMEKVIPNSGFPGGKFLQRTKVINPETMQPYQPDEVSIGRDVTLGGWKFHLKSASEGTLRTMEAKSDIFTRSDLCSVLLPLNRELKSRVSDLKTAFARRDKTHRGRVRREEVAEVLEEFNVNLGEQELITLFRRFQFADSELFEYNDFLETLK